MCREAAVATVGLRRVPGRAGRALAVLGLAVATGCGTTAGPRPDEDWLASPVAPIAPAEHPVALVPGPEDRAAARLLEAALASRRTDADAALRDLDRIDRERRSRGDDETGLHPLAVDLRNAMLDDDTAYREAARDLRGERGIDPALARRLDVAVDDDPLELARDRVWDWRMSVAAQLVNTVSEPVANSLITGGTTSLYSGAVSLLRLLAKYYGSDPLTLQQRQALTHWREHIRRHPDSEEAADLRDDVERWERKLHKTLRNHELRAAKRAMSAENYDLAKEYAEDALGHVPEDDKARKLLAKAIAAIDEREALEQRSQGAWHDAGSLPTLDSFARAGDAAWAGALGFGGPPRGGLLESLLNPETSPVELELQARTLLESSPNGLLADEATYVLALAESERGAESAAHDRLTELAGRDPRRSNMARHAQALLAHPYENAHEQFEKLRWLSRRRWTGWLVFGNYSNGPSIQGVHPLIGYALDLHSIAQTAATTPLRILQYPWLKAPDFYRGAAASARRYLARHPDGEHADEMIDWLLGYERKRGNWVATYKLLEMRPDADPQELVEAREKAAAQMLSVAERQTRSDAYNGMLRQIVREFPRTSAARSAGTRARSEAEERSTQHIRLSRGFLKENPRVAGPQGLGLRASLLDGHNENGELHPAGVTFVGGRTLEFWFVARSGSEKEPAVRFRQEYTAEELARLVSLIDETALRNAQIDPDDDLGSDAARDLYFERVRLGLADQPDRRATSESRYAYEGVRERYGLVRGRESVLPIDIVVQGSLTEFQLGAFPKLKEPRKTPDSFLYR